MVVHLRPGIWFSKQGLGRLLIYSTKHHKSMQKTAICGSTARGSGSCITSFLPAMAFKNKKRHRYSRSVMILAMKLTFVLLTAAFLNVSAKGFSQEKISFSGENVPLEKVFSVIKKQTGYGLTYKANIFKDTRPVSIEAKELSLEQFLNIVLKGQPIRYTLASKTILLTRKTNDEPTVLQKALSLLDSLYMPPPVSGKVTDEKGEPLPGVSVSVKGSAISTTTGNDGTFTFQDIPADATLVFSFVGMKTQEQKIAGRKNLVVKMEIQIQSLGEVVTVGYGQARKQDLTGAVGQVSVEDLKKAPVRSFDEALAGRVAGVTVSSTDGQPGSAINIVVRGNNSITQDNSPLYVVDGFPIEDPDNNMINPEDIESLVVLKDASATAIYGARGANGVILITTKKGKEGAAKVTMNAWYGFQQIPSTPALLSPYEFVKLQLERSPGDTTSPNSAAYRYLRNGLTLDNYKDTGVIDWQSKMFRVAPMRNYSISITGGTATTKYAISGSILSQDGVVINSDYKRYQGRVVLDQLIGKHMKVGINTNYSYMKQRGISPSASAMSGGSVSSAMMFSIWGYRPFGDGLDEDERDEDIDPSVDFRYNPVVNQQNTVRDNNFNNLTINAYAEYDITPELKLRVTGGITNNQRQAVQFNNEHTYMGNPKLRQGGINGSVVYYHNNSWVNENTLTYTKRFNRDHSLILLAGFTEQAVNTSAYGGSASILPEQASDINWLDNGTPSSITARASTNTLASFLWRANYNFRSKYLLTASFRADGSSKFAPENHWSYFPSGAIAWRISEEKFMKNIGAISDAKLRASYGVTGNNRVGDFPYLSQFSTSPISQGYTFNNENIPGTIPFTLGNPRLKWETTSQIDIGLDLEFFNGRIGFTADAYSKKTTDLILNSTIPSSYGYSTIYKNIGSVQNQGLEFSLNTLNVRTTDFTWSSSFNISFNANKVLALTENQESITNLYAPYDNGSRTVPAFIAKVGSPLGLLYGPVWDGIYQISDFNEVSGAYVLKNTVPTNGNVRTSIQPGDVKYKDINGDGIVDNRDFAVTGRGIPIHTGGFGNNFTYKGFDLNVFFQWSYGNNILNINRLVFESASRNGLNQFASFADRWTPENASNTIHRTKGEGPVANQYSTRVIEDGSYLRLKTVALGYTLPASITKRINIGSVRIYASGQNLLTWTKYSGLDPEVSIYNSVLTPGVDYSAYPRARTITFGANVTF